MEKIFLNYLQIDFMIENIVRNIRKSKINFDRVVGIENGGLNVSKPISYVLRIPHESIRISFYREDCHTVSDEPEVDISGLSPIEKDEKILVVDDSVDSGSTIMRFKEETKLVQRKDFWLATLHWNPNSIYDQKPDFYSRKKENQWIVYPWECTGVV